MRNGEVYTGYMHLSAEKFEIKTLNHSNVNNAFFSDTIDPKILFRLKSYIWFVDPSIIFATL